MAANQNFQKPPWPSELAEKLKNQTEYLQQIRNMRNAKSILDPNGRAELALKFKEAVDDAQYEEHIRARASQFEQALENAEDRLRTAPELSKAHEIVDLYRHRSLTDIQIASVEKVISALEERPQYIPDVIARLRNVPGISIEDLGHVRQAIQAVDAHTQSSQKKWEQLRDGLATTETQMQVLCAKLEQESIRAEKFKRIAKMLAIRDHVVDMDMISMLVDADSPYAGLKAQLEREFADNLRLQKELDVVKHELSQAKMAVNKANSQQASLAHVRKLFSESQNRVLGLEAEVSEQNAIKERLEVENEEHLAQISQLKKINQGYYLGQTSQLMQNDQNQLEHARRLSGDNPTSLLDIDQLRRAYQEHTGEIERVKTALKMFEDVSGTEKLRSEDVRVRIKNQVATSDAQLRTTTEPVSTAQKGVQKLSVDLTKPDEVYRKLQSSGLNEQRVTSEARDQVTKLQAGMDERCMQTQGVANNRSSIEALEIDVAELSLKLKSTSEDRKKLKAELATVSESALQAKSENQQLKKHVCMVLLRKINVDYDDCGEVHTHFSHASKLAIQLQGTYPVRKSIRMLSTIHDMVAETTDRSFSAWNIALLVLTRQQVVSVAMIDAFAVELGRVEDQEYWLVVAILLFFVRRCLTKGRQMPFCTSMVVLRAIEVLVGVGITAELAVLVENKDRLNAGCLVQAFFRCIKARMQGHHPVLEAELQPVLNQIVTIEDGWLTPDEDTSSLLFSNGVKTFLIRRHQFQLRFGARGLELTFNDPAITELLPSAISPESSSTLFTLRDAIRRINGGAVAAEQSSLEMRMDESFLLVFE